MKIYYCTYKNNSREKELRNQATKEFKDLTQTEIKKIAIGATVFMFAAMNNILYAKTSIEKWTDKLDSEGNKILQMIQLFGYWAAIVFAAIDIVKDFRKQDISAIFSTALKYLAGVGILYGLPTFFDMAKEIFQ